MLREDFKELNGKQQLEIYKNSSAISAAAHWRGDMSLSKLQGLKKTPQAFYRAILKTKSPQVQGDQPVI